MKINKKAPKGALCALIILGIFLILFLTWNYYFKLEDFSSIVHTSIEKLKNSEEEKKLLSKYVYSALDSKFSKSDKSNLQVPEIAGYEYIYLTFLNNNKLRCCQRGWIDKNNTERTKSDIEDAIDRCLKDKRYGEPIKPEEVKDLTLSVNVSLNKQRIAGDSLEDLEKQIELGVNALEVRKGEKYAFFKESVPITNRYTFKKTLERLCLKAKLPKTCYLDPHTQLFKFDTLTFLGDRTGKITDLYRYNVLVKPEEINNNLLLSRIKLIPEWFSNNVDKKTGRSEYMYYPDDDKYSKDNNHVRQMASTWSMAYLKNYFKNPDLDKIIEKNLEYYSKLTICERGLCRVEIDGKSSLAYNAFLILALLEKDDNPEKDVLTKSLVNKILSLQRKNGSYQTDLKSAFDSYGDSEDSGIDFYPGEAMLALIKYYQKTGDQRVLESVKRAFYFYRTYWRNNQSTAFVPWHIQADFILYQATENPEVSEFILEMSDWILGTQTVGSPYPDKNGGFYSPNPNNSTFVQIEGLNDAYVLAKELGDQEREKKYSEAIKKAIEYLLMSQFTQNNTFYLENPKKALGGFRSSPASIEQRIDFMQHAAFALIKTYRNNIYK